MVSNVSFQLWDMLGLFRAVPLRIDLLRVPSLKAENVP